MANISGDFSFLFISSNFALCPKGEKMLPWEQKAKYYSHKYKAPAFNMVVLYSFYFFCFIFLYILLIYYRLLLQWITAIAILLVLLLLDFIQIVVYIIRLSMRRSLYLSLRVHLMLLLWIMHLLVTNLSQVTSGRQQTGDGMGMFQKKQHKDSPMIEV